MNLDSLPPEILDLIAHYILISELGDNNHSKGLCHYTDDTDAQHRPARLTTSPPFPAGSSIFDLASVSRYIRNVLFLSRDPRFVKVMYAAEGRGKADGISPTLLASVSKLRLVSRKRPLELLATQSISTIKHQGIGDVLLPYHALQHLEIDWHVLPLGDPRLRAMEDCANAVPVMKFDLRCSRACTLSTVGDLHVSLGSGTTPIDGLRAELMGQQLDLIFQQFDLPALRTVHFSHDFTGDMDALVIQWKKLLPAIRLQYWPYLEAVQICVAAPYHFSTPDNPVEGYDPTQVPIWRPLVKEIVTHMATCKKPLDVNITLHWKFQVRPRPGPPPSPFKDDTASKPALRDELMPTAKAFDDFVAGLEGRAGTRPFSLQIYASGGSQSKEPKRLLRATHRPDRMVEEGTSSASKNPSTTTYEIHQDNIDQLSATLSEPVPEVEQAAGTGLLGELRRFSEMHRRHMIFHPLRGQARGRQLGDAAGWHAQEVAEDVGAGDAAGDVERAVRNGGRYAHIPDWDGDEDITLLAAEWAE